MKREELLKQRKVKILIEGDSGAGKSHCAVQCAKLFKTLYLDIDDGAFYELMNLTDDELENIDRATIKSYEELLSVIKKSINYELVVFDMIHPHIKKWTRKYVRDYIITKGYYISSGGKKVIVEDPEIFELQGFLYGISNSKEEDIYETLRKLPCHVIGLSYPLDDDPYKNTIRGFFDIVIKLYKGINGREAKIIKIRGNEDVEGKFTSRYIEALQNKLLNK